MISTVTPRHNGRKTEIRLKQIWNISHFWSFLFISFIAISNNRNPPITVEFCWSLSIRNYRVLLNVLLDALSTSGIRHNVLHDNLNLSMNNNELIKKSHLISLFRKICLIIIGCLLAAQQAVLITAGLVTVRLITAGLKTAGLTTVGLMTARLITTELILWGS